MLELDIDLDALSVEELSDAESVLHRATEEAEAHDPAHLHPELRHLFEALETAVHEEASARAAAEERHRIAEALGVEETTGEWLAGA